MNNEVGQKLARLKCLVEQVILTKKSWGYPTLVSQPMSRLASYVNSDGGVVIIKEAEPHEVADSRET